MRKNRLTIALLVLVLVAGAGTGIWVLTQSPGAGHNTVAGGNIDDGFGSSIDEGSPLNGTGSNSAPAGNESAGNGLPANNPRSNGAGSGNSKPAGKDDPEVTQPDPAEETDWVEGSIEATVRGRVSMKSDDRPALGATVKLEMRDWRAALWGWNWGQTPVNEKKPDAEVSGEATTDGAGEYTLRVTLKFWYAKTADDTEPPANAWSGLSEQVVVVATSPGYAPAKSESITLNPEKESIVNLKLAVPAAVTGRVIDSLTQQGIAGARGHLNNIENFSGRRSVPATFITDEQGYFALNSLPAGNYTLSIWADGYADYNGWQEQGRVNLSGGGEMDIGDIAMLPATSVTGRVISAESSKPIAGASVELRKPQQWGNVQSNSATSGEDGTFRLTDVEPGTYTLRVRAEGYAIRLQDSLTIEVGHVVDLGDQTLVRGLALTGVVVNPENEPLAGVSVKLQEPKSGSFDFGGTDRTVAETTSDAEGKFTLSGASEGKWVLSATLEGYATYVEDLEIATAPKAITIKLSRGGTIRGRLLDAAGNPLAGTPTVGATSQDSNSYVMFKAQPTTMIGMLYSDAKAMKQTDEDGNFELTNIPAGTYVVFSFAAETAPVWKDDVRVEDERVTDIGDLKASSPGKLQVTVTENGAPVQGIEVSVIASMGMMGGGGAKAITDNMGTALVDKVPEGTWFVRTSRDQNQFDTDMNARRVVIKAGQTTEFQLELRPKEGVFLHGRVTMNGKATITDIILMGLGDLSAVMKSANPVEGGYYEFIGLKPGSYVMHVREGDKNVTARVNLDLPEEGEREFNGEFKGYKVGGTVTTPEDSAAQRSSVSVTIAHANPERPSFSSWMRGSTACSTDGSFQFDNVSPGEYVITATLDGVGSAKTALTVTGSDSPSLNLVISNNSGKIKVTLGKLHGTPVSGGGFGMMTLLDAGGAPVDLGEGFQGFFMISQGSNQVMPNVPPGTYTVSISSSGYLPKEISGIVVEKDKTTQVDAELTAAAELYLSVTNPEVTQAMLDGAATRYFTANGTEVARESNPFDSMSSEAPPEAPTLIAKYISSSVTEVRIKLDGYSELIVAVSFEPGRKIEKQESLLAE